VHPHGIFEHRKHCICQEERKQQKALAKLPLSVDASVQPSHLHQNTFLQTNQFPRHAHTQNSSSLSGIITLFTHLQTHSPLPSPSSTPCVSDFQIPTIRRPKHPLICPGSAIDWMPGSIWETYPYHQHEARVVGWKPIGFDSKKNQIFVCSESCIMEITEYNASPCTHCRNIQYSVEFRKFMEWAKEAKEHTLWQYLSSKQLLQLLRKMAA